MKSTQSLYIHSLCFKVTHIGSLGLYKKFADITSLKSSGILYSYFYKNSAIIILDSRIAIC